MQKNDETFVDNFTFHFTVCTPLTSPIKEAILDSAIGRDIKDTRESEESGNNGVKKYKMKANWSGLELQSTRRAPILHGYAHAARSANHFPPLETDQFQSAYTFESDYRFTRSQKHHIMDKPERRIKNEKSGKSKKNLSKSQKNVPQVKWDSLPACTQRCLPELTPIEPARRRRVNLYMTTSSGNDPMAKVALPDVGQPIKEFKCANIVPKVLLKPLTSIVCKGVGGEQNGKTTSKKKHVWFYLLVLVQDFDGTTGKFVSKPYPIMLKKPEGIEESLGGKSTAVT